MAAQTQAIEEQVLAALEAGAAEQGLDVVSVEVSGPAGHPTLRVRVDLVDGTPIDMDRVTAATPWVAGVVEELDPFPGSYELEVSSPGIDRPLRRAADFARFAGERAEVATRAEVAGRHSFTGTIVAAGDASVTVDVDGTSYELPLAEVKRAKLKPDFDQIMAAAKKAAKEAEARGEFDLDDDADDEDGE